MGSPRAKITHYRSPVLVVNGAVLVAMLSYQLGASHGLPGSECYSVSQRKNLLLLEFLTASSLLKRDLREHLHHCHRPFLAAWTSFLIQDTLQPWATLLFMAVILFNCSNREKSLVRVQDIRKGRLGCMFSSYISTDSSSTVGHKAFWSQEEECFTQSQSTTQTIC